MIWKDEILPPERNFYKPDFFDKSFELSYRTDRLTGVIYRHETLRFNVLQRGVHNSWTGRHVVQLCRRLGYCR